MLRNSGNLRTLTLVVLLLAFLGLALGQWVSALWLYDGSFEAAERGDALARIRHGQAIMRDRADFLARNAGDNATWDEPYDFMLGRDPNLPDRVFTPETHRQLGLSAFAYVRPDGRLAEIREYDSGSQAFGAPSKDLLDAALRNVAADRWQSPHQSSGFMLVHGRPYAWGSATIKHTDGTGVDVGRLVLIGEIDNEFVLSASATLDSSVELAVHTASEGAAEPAHEPASMQEVAFRIRADGQLESRLCLGALGNERLLDLILVTPRSIHGTASRASSYFLWSTLLYGTLITVLAVWFVERRLLQPVQSASQALVDIGRSGDLSRRLAEPTHDDQLRALVGAANEMLAALEKTRAIEAARDVAVAESRLKSEFLARMSHEIRTPLNGVLGMADLLARSGLSERQANLLSVAQQSGSALLAVINDILDFSKIEDGTLLLAASPFDPKALVTGTAELYATEARNKGLDFSVAADDSLPPLVRGDGARLRQALGNLIANAVKFTEHGRIGVHASAAAADERAVRLSVAVTDSGIGIETCDVERIFDAFGQADTARTRKFGGTGLGLSIARHLARQMGGDIRVRSEPGVGSEFTLTVVLQRAEEAPASPQAAQATACEAELLA